MCIIISQLMDTDYLIMVDKSQIIGVFNGCEVRIENSVTRVTVRLHEAYRVMPNTYPEWRNFGFTPKSIIESFSCILFIRRLYLSLDMCYCVNFTLNFNQEMFGSAPIYDALTSLWWCRLTPLGIRRQYPEQVKIVENRVGCARISHSERPNNVSISHLLLVSKKRWFINNFGTRRSNCLLRFCEFLNLFFFFLSFFFFIWHGNSFSSTFVCMPHIVFLIQSYLNRSHLYSSTNICLVDFSILIKCTSPFPVLGLPGVLCNF